MGRLPVLAAALAVLAALALAVTTAPGSARGTAAAAPRVTLIGDSVAGGVVVTPQARALLTRGIDLDLEVAVCRRLVGQSCPYQGTLPPTLVDVAQTARLAPTVVVAVGYNDFESTFPQSLETALAALRKAGAQRVLWLTYREERDQYAHMNDDLRAAASRHPELQLVDWNMYARSHPDWFQDDGLHLGYGGAMGMAALIRNALVDAGVVAAPLRLTRTSRLLPAGRVGRPYALQLRVTGSAGPLRWRVQRGALPSGLALSKAGRITGIPRAAGSRRVRVRATDTLGLSASWPLELVVQP